MGEERKAIIDYIQHPPERKMLRPRQAGVLTTTTLPPLRPEQPLLTEITDDATAAAIAKLYACSNCKLRAIATICLPCGHSRLCVRCIYLRGAEERFRDIGITCPACDLQVGEILRTYTVFECMLY